jgi:tetratricopeptide (TPR) repeat protein/CHAT domain-containing protein
LLEAALQLREAKPALFAGAMGVLIVNVVPGSQAAEKGLQPGDIVIAYAGEAMNSAEQLVMAVQEKTKETQVDLRIIRGGKMEKMRLRGGKIGVELKNILPKESAEFLEQANAAIQSNDLEKLLQLIRENPKLAKEVLPHDLFINLEQSSLLSLPKGTIKVLKQIQAAGNDSDKVIQIIRENPKMAKEFLPPDLLAQVEQSRNFPGLDRLQEEGKQAYYQSNYPLALNKWQAGLDQARKLADKRYISLFISNLGSAYDNLGQYTKALEHHQQALAIDKELGDKRGEGRQLNNLSGVYQNLGQFTKALDYSLQALAIHREFGDKNGEGDDMTSLSNVYSHLGQYSKALEYYQQALVIHRELGDKRGEANDLGNLGAVYNYLSQYPKSLEYCQQALAIRKELDDKRGEGSDLTNLGVVYSNLGQYPKALEYFQQALAIEREIHDSYKEASVLNNIGALYLTLGQSKQALDYHQQALAINEKISNQFGVGVALSNIGSVYQQLGQYSNALDFYQQALTIDRKLDAKHEEGNDLLNLGVTYWNLSQYTKALDYYQQSLDIYRELGDKRGEGNGLGNLGGVYNELGQYLKAVEYYQQALAINRKIGNKDGEGSNLSNLGGAYSNLGEPAKALEYLNQALAIHQELGNKGKEASNLDSLGVVYMDLGQFATALNYSLQALAINKEIGGKYREGHNLNNIGVVYRKLGEYEKAKTYFQDCVTIVEALGLIKGLWLVQRNLATTEVLLKQPQDAIRHYEQSLSTLEQLRASLTVDLEKHTGIQTRDLKTSFMQNKFHVYDELINLYHDQGDDQKAFETFERKQGRAFLEDMARSGVRRYVDLPVEISQKEETLETQVEAAHKIKEEAAGKGGESVKQADEQVATAKTARDAFQAELKVNHPRYYDLKHPQPVKLPDLQQNVLQEGELLLIYNVREEATDLWLVGKQHFQMFSLPMTEAQVKEQVAKFRESGIDKADTSGKSNDLTSSLERNVTDFTQASQALYQQLFPATVRTLLGEVQPKLLYIVPTSALYELPFEALVTENTDKPHYLLQDYAISYLSSASLLKTLRDAKQRRGTTQRQPLLAFADPVYPTQDCQLKDDSLLAQQVRDYYALLIDGGLDEKSECPKKLPSEAQSIIKSLELKEDSEPPFLISGNDASRQTLLTMNSKGQLEDSKYVVFSTHGLVPNKITPLMQPALLLSHTTPLEQEKDENGEMVLKGFLTMSDVFRLKMNADLVMLSACNTGRGETIKGEGTIGLTRAFMYAGTPAVSITLWSIEALAAKKLNVAWFTRLKAGQPLADSLREAKLEMLDKSGYYPYPYAWAGVVVFGDGK